MNAYCYVDSPIGRLLLTTDGAALTGLYMEPSHQAQSTAGWQEDAAAGALPSASRQLGEYFRGTRRDFALPLNLSGTAFQQRVWRELLDIPYGETWSYGQLAARIGKPSASRAVGLANGSNPISVIVPCHRVIGANGALTGYGGGLPRKRWLLGHEGALTRGLDLDQRQSDGKERTAAVGAIVGNGAAAVKFGHQAHDVQP
ncbi:MAG TPA: methylated-DNA--[protein]-cysteine S-methyltransferase [Steroidobacteraceae bacterium]|jgi:methylated-DNA-[protein]-cysteine S-methyltransferase